MKSSVIALALAGALWALPAAAAEVFVVNVPVEFKNLEPAVTKVAIHCRVVTTKSDGTINTYHPLKSTMLPIQGGRYAGPSPIKFVFNSEDFAPQELAVLDKVNQAQCTFALVTASGEVEVHGNETKSPLMHQPGTPFAWQAYGKFAP